MEKIEEINKDVLKEIYKKRIPNTRKYDFGLLLIIGGSQFYSGSPALAAMAAFRAGVDMARIIAPKRAADIIASFSPNLAAYPLEGNWLTKKHLATLISMTKSAEIVSKGKTAVVIGGGMGRTEETQEAILEYLSQISVPVVINTDAIHALEKNPKIISGKPFLIISSRHEFFLLTGKKVYDISQEEKIETVKQEAKKLETTILLKGDPGIISDGKNIALNKAGTPYMTVGGTGDSLAGIAGTLLCRKINSFQVGCAASLINGLAGERAAKKFGASMTTTDLIEEIHRILPSNLNDCEVTQ